MQCSHTPGSGECDYCDVGFVIADGQTTRDSSSALTHAAFMQRILSHRSLTQQSMAGGSVKERRVHASSLIDFATVEEWARHAEPGDAIEARTGMIYCVRWSEWPGEKAGESPTAPTEAVPPSPPAPEPVVPPAPPTPVA